MLILLASLFQETLRIVPDERAYHKFSFGALRGCGFGGPKVEREPFSNVRKTEHSVLESEHNDRGEGLSKYPLDSVA